MNPKIEIGGRSIGPNEAVYIIAEMSANHNQKFEDARRILEAAKESGADALKLQTYTADTITIPCENEYFRIEGNSPWAGKKLYDLYQEASTPWEWQPQLKELADDLGIDLFSTPFDASAVDFLERMDVPAYKVSSFEVVDLPLLTRIAKTGKPIILSTGMATLGEIEEAVHTIESAGGSQLALLKCTSDYPAIPEEMNLRTIPDLRRRFQVPVGLSDHCLRVEIAIASVALGACIIEKHLTLSRNNGGPDSAFSLEPDEFKHMVDAVKSAEKALGNVSYEAAPNEKKNLLFRKSLFVVKDVKAGEIFTEDNVRSIRPGHGLHTRYLSEVIGKRARIDIARGRPLDWKMIGRD